MAMTRRRCRHRTTGRRQGIAAVELAVCLPVLIFTFLAALQAADMIFLKQTLQVASYEAARTAIRHNATNDQALASGTVILTSRDVASFTITTSPTDLGSARRGDLVSVTVQALTDTNTVLPNWFSSTPDITVTTKMVKE